MKMNEDELAHGLSGTSGSWHAQYKGNAWVYCGGFDPRLNEGDVLAVFSQYGEIEDLHLVRDTDTGKSKGFAFSNLMWTWILVRLGRLSEKCRRQHPLQDRNETSLRRQTCS